MAKNNTKNNIQEIENYIKLPLWFIQMASNKNTPFYLTPFEQQLYLLIRGLCNSVKCYASDQYFINVFKVSKKHVNKSIHKLEYYELIKIVHNNNKRYIELGNNIKEGCVLVCWSKEQERTVITQKGVYKYSKNDLNNLSIDDLIKL